MSYVTTEEIVQARQMDLLTYLKNYEPGELVKISNGNYCTREHDSLKISNGKWMWWSRGFGGNSALDYLIKVKGISNVYIFQIIRGYRSDKNFLSISDFYHFSVLLLHFKTGMGGYCVIEIFVKYYVTSAVTPAANVNSYAYCRWMTCGVLDIYAHD